MACCSAAGASLQLDGGSCGVYLRRRIAGDSAKSTWVLVGAVLTVVALCGVPNLAAQSAPKPPTNLRILHPADVDITAPVIANISVGLIATSGAAIMWTTDEPADSQVEYGTTSTYGSVTPLNASLVTAHSVTLSGLQAGTTYHYLVKSRDAAGNLAAMGDFTFTMTASNGIWIGTTELAMLPMSGTEWSEVLAAADAAWTVQGIEVQSSHEYHQQALAGALVYARLAPSASAQPYRAKVAQAIRNVIAVPTVTSSSVTAPSRNLGAWAINADLIDLPRYDAVLDAQFRTWLVAKLDRVYTSSPATIRLSVQRPNNIGAWSRFALVASAWYLGDTVTLQSMARAMRRWLGDTSIDYTFLWYGDQTWHMSTVDATKVGINPRGANKDGHNFDGIQAEDQNRGVPAGYDRTNFPSDYSAVRYNEVALAATVGTVLMLHRAGYTDLVDASDQAVLRAAQWIKYAADTFPEKGYLYFTDSREAARPLFNYLYPSANLPATRVRSQSAGSEFGYAWTYWTHGR
jgi:hypothetical protein